MDGHDKMRGNVRKNGYLSVYIRRLIPASAFKKKKKRSGGKNGEKVKINKERTQKNLGF